MATAFRVQPDCAIILEGTTANDTIGARVHEEICSAGKGPALSFMDRASIAHPGLFARMRALAQERNIPWQLKRGTTGGNDARQHPALPGRGRDGRRLRALPLHSRPVLGLRALRRGKPVPLGQGLSR